jgi:hypothetical protein
VIFYEITGFQSGGFLPIISINDHAEIRGLLSKWGNIMDFLSIFKSLIEVKINGNSNNDP